MIQITHPSPLKRVYIKSKLLYKKKNLVITITYLLHYDFDPRNMKRSHLHRKNVLCCCDYQKSVVIKQAA